MSLERILFLSLNMTMKMLITPPPPPPGSSPRAPTGSIPVAACMLDELRRLRIIIFVGGVDAVQCVSLNSPVCQFEVRQALASNSSVALRSFDQKATSILPLPTILMPDASCPHMCEGSRRPFSNRTNVVKTQTFRAKFLLKPGGVRADGPVGMCFGVHARKGISVYCDGGRVGAGPALCIPLGI
jgi:hypothetical protein